MIRKIGWYWKNEVFPRDDAKRTCVGKKRDSQAGISKTEFHPVTDKRNKMENIGVKKNRCEPLQTGGSHILGGTLIAARQKNQERTNKEGGWEDGRPGNQKGLPNLRSHSLANSQNSDFSGRLRSKLGGLKPEALSLEGDSTRGSTCLRLEGFITGERWKNSCGSKKKSQEKC